MDYPPRFKNGANQDNTLRVNTQSVTFITDESNPDGNIKYTPTANQNTIILERNNAVNLEFRCHNLTAGDTINLIAISAEINWGLLLGGDYIGVDNSTDVNLGSPVVINLIAVGDGRVMEINKAIG